MSFYLVRLEPDGNGGMCDVPIPDYGPYDKGSDAAKIAKTLTDERGYKVQPRRMSQAPDWRARQKERLASGTLKALPEKWDLPPVEDHFAHIDPRDASKIAFTESDEHGTIDRTTSLTPGRYITRYFNHIDDAHRRRLIAAIDPNGEIFYAWTPQEIAHVYMRGPSSCMDGDHDFSDLEPHWPTEPYGGGDLAVAYTKNAQGRIQSRSLCWPEQKLFGRVYGDIERMIAAMKAEGFTYIRGEDKTFPSGAKILKIEHPTEDHQYIMPYFDDIEMVVDKGTHFETFDGPSVDLPPGTSYISCGGSGGHSFLYRICPRLRSGSLAHEFKFVHGANQDWSRTAYQAYAFTCSGSGKLYSNEFKVPMATPGIYWSRDHFEAHGEHCYVTRKNHPKTEMVQKGNRRVHNSVEHRFDDNGKELAIKSRKQLEVERLAAMGMGDVTVTIGDLVSAQRPWRRGMRDLVDAFDYGLTTTTQQIVGRHATQVIIDDPDIHVANNLDPEQVQQMARWMNDLVERQITDVRRSYEMPRELLLGEFDRTTP
jgi:hypothetical protein